MDESPSQHAQLEVAILGSEPAPLEATVDDRVGEASSGRAVLILGADPEVRAYIRRCLQTLEEISLMEALIWSEVREQYIDTLPQLIVVEASTIAMAGVLGGFLEPYLEDVPRLLILDDRVSDCDFDFPGPCLVIAKPFNAERLVSAASTLFGDLNAG